MDRHFDVPNDPTTSSNGVRIVSFDVEPYPDGRRLKCTLILTPPNTPSDVEIVIEDHEGHTVAGSNIVGLVDNKAVFTMHLPEPASDGSFLARVSLIHPDEGLEDQKEVIFMTPNASIVEGE
ncbi:MAG TPA: hypothetical protein G4O11_12695 [Anaerolineae bacterium]|nr:hypothetical protein [Anaerolineae bacterium]